MNLGIIGVGVVGSAILNCYSNLGIACAIHDKGLNTDISDVLKTEAVFICVPTPSNLDGSCDISIVESVVDELIDKNYTGIIMIKSTVSPGTVERLNNKHNTTKIAFVPEFLREHNAINDFNVHGTLIVGSSDNSVCKKIVEIHAPFTNDYEMCSPTEAEIVKYYHNTFNAMRVVFANAYYEVCKMYSADYNTVLDIFTKRNNLPKNYLQVSDDLRGYGGSCLPKDTRALATMLKNTKINIFDAIEQDNKQYKSTVLPGMRKEQ